LTIGGIRISNIKDDFILRSVGFAAEIARPTLTYVRTESETMGKGDVDNLYEGASLFEMLRFVKRVKALAMMS
jgi:hypothetical protein